MKKLTLEDIGKLAGVSRATVSRVMNGYQFIRPEVRERVERVIAETGYQPNLVARSLASDRSNIIGLIIPSSAQSVLLDPYFPILLKGVSHAANLGNLTFSLFLFHTLEEEQRTLRSILNTGLLDGLIITADRKEDFIITQCLEKEMPIVLIGRPEKNAERVNYVDADNEQGGFLATEHLIKLGYRRIATVATSQNTAGDDRLAGYIRALQEHHIEVDSDLIVYGDYSMDSSYQAMQQLLKQPLEAVFVSSDTMALGALRAIREAGLRVPEDIALVGFDDLVPALQADPPLTTIHQSIENAGRRGVEILIDVVNDPTMPPKHVVFPVELIIRESCGALANG